MPRNRKSDSNGTALATIEPPALPPINRSEAYKVLKRRAQELYHDIFASLRECKSALGSAPRPSLLPRLRL